MHLRALWPALLSTHTSLLRSNCLHLLMVEQSLQYKIISITHNLLHKSEPTSLRNLINIKPTGKTRFSDHLCHSHPPLIPSLNSLIVPSVIPPLVSGIIFLLISELSHNRPSPTASVPSLTPLPFAPLSLSRNQLLYCLTTHLFSPSYPLNCSSVLTYHNHFQPISSVHALSD